MKNPFASFPDDARLWIYLADRPISAGEQPSMLQTLNGFFADWSSHARPVTGAAQILHDRFLLVAAFIPGGDISGCGIDASVHQIDALGAQHGISWLSGLNLAYRDSDGKLQVAPRPMFRTHVRNGLITAETPVFDTSISTLKDFRSGMFEQAAGQSWHARVFRIKPVLAIITLLCLFLTQPIQAQYSYMNEDALTRLADSQTQPLDSVPVAEYKYYVVKDSSKLEARLRLYRRIGYIADRSAGRKELVQLLNRNDPPVEYLEPGDTLVVPLKFDLDLRAYTPFPRYYEGGASFDKLIVIDKTLQAFAAYEEGRLLRWGPVSTGDLDSPTPAGRYNLNWKVRERVSSLSPPDQRWIMYNVFNFHELRGMHLHRYPLPLDGAVSHGCVRMSDADSKWIYDWADGWTRQQEHVIKQGTTLIIIGEEEEHVRPFHFTPEGPKLKMAVLPDDPYSIPPGTDQQRRFDKIRLNQQSQAGG